VGPVTHNVTEWSTQDWFTLGQVRTMQLMTITYANGTVLKAIVLSHGEHEIRAVAGGRDDVLVFTRIHGTWISEEIEPVTIEFEWQRHGSSHTCSVDDCVCPKELAARLIATLLGGCEREEWL
jgi:hypothetical protein